jgi:hypothetical protein
MIEQSNRERERGNKQDEPRDDDRPEFGSNGWE